MYDISCLIEIIFMFDVGYVPSFHLKAAKIFDWTYSITPYFFPQHIIKVAIFLALDNTAVYRMVVFMVDNNFKTPWNKALSRVILT